MVKKSVKNQIFFIIYLQIIVNKIKVLFNKKDLFFYYLFTVKKIGIKCISKVSFKFFKQKKQIKKEKITIICLTLKS